MYASLTNGSLDVAILGSNKVTGTVMTFRGCLSVAFVDGAGQSELSIMNNKIFLLMITVCSNYIDTCLNNSVLRPALIINCSEMRGTSIRAICKDSVQVFTLSITTYVGVPCLAKLFNCFFNLLPCFFFCVIFTELVSTFTIVAN